MVAFALWHELRSPDFDALDAHTTVALLPLAAIEQHGPHLPLGTDALIVDAIVDAALKRSDDGLIIRLPTQCIGLSPEHASFRGTLTLDAETVLAAWTGIGRCVHAAGLRKLVLFNGHGGQTSIVDLVAQRLRQDRGLMVVRANYFRFALPPGWIGADERRFGLHGGQVETALVLAIAPNLVDRREVGDFRSHAARLAQQSSVLAVEGEVGIAWQAEDLNAAGVTGNAARATAEFGHRLLDHYAARLAGLLQDVVQVTFPPHAGGV
jgi:creatinine amidohydrolase